MMHLRMGSYYEPSNCSFPVKPVYSALGKLEETSSASSVTTVSHRLPSLSAFKTKHYREPLPTAAFAATHFK